MPSPRISTRARQRDQRREIFERDGRLDLGDGVSLYRHPRSSFIYADFRIGDERTRESTKTSDVAIAQQVALRRRKALACRAEAGKPISMQGPSVGDVLESYVADLVRRRDAGEHKLGPEISVMQRNFMPFWRTVPLPDLDRRQFYAWERWRLEQNVEGATVAAYKRGTSTVSVGRKLKPPSQNTLRREKQYFVKALTWACDQPAPLISDEVVHGLRHLPRPRESKKQRVAGEKRTALTAVQVEKLLAEFGRVEDVERARVQKLGERGKRKNYDRRLMALHVRLLLCTGLRPGAEILELTWDRLSQVKNEHGEDIVVIDRCGDGKTGPRMVNADPEAVKVLADLRTLLKEFGFADAGQETLWPSRRGGVVRDMGASFKSTLKRLGFDATISGEPLYICRHTYLTERLRKGVTSDILAINCGTSNEMISRHYNHLRSEDIRGALRPADARNPLRLNVTRSPISGETKLTLDPTGQIVFTR
ncbi:site-specific integrase [Methylobacterium sp. B1]|uniref:site-specific integrase n=1 Tax=Methylobacterium sp. B1 TaxID=91459 RepID=UPI0005BAA47D|nr:site-specific integrase [Methylobacterium sp. B1]